MNAVRISAGDSATMSAARWPGTIRRSPFPRSPFRPAAYPVASTPATRQIVSSPAVT